MYKSVYISFWFPEYQRIDGAFVKRVGYIASLDPEELANTLDLKENPWEMSVVMDVDHARELYDFLKDLFERIDREEAEEENPHQKVYNAIQTVKDYLTEQYTAPLDKTRWVVDLKCILTDVENDLIEDGALDTTWEVDENTDPKDIRTLGKKKSVLDDLEIEDIKIGGTNGNE